jgi:hypothetical protein
MKEIVGEKAVVAKDKTYKEIKLGRIAGPFHFPPFPTLRISPISVILKRSSSEYRLIHNLSFPEHGSFNDFIDKELCIVKYSTIDDAIKMIHKFGKNAKLAKCDIKSAFRLFRLSPGDFDLMGFKFENQYFFVKRLLMGAYISCSLFEKFQQLYIGSFSRSQIMTIFYITLMIFYLVGKLKPNNAAIL